MRGFTRILLALLTTACSSIAGIVFRDMLIGNYGFVISLSVLSLFPIVFFIINVVLVKNYSNSMRQKKVAEMNKYILSHRVEAETTARVKLKQIQSIRRLTLLFAAVILITAIGTSVLAGVLLAINVSLYVLCLCYSTLVFYALYSRINVEKNFEVDKNGIIYLHEMEYPTIYLLAKRAAKALGCCDEIVIILSLDCNATIFREKNRYVLQIGIILLHIVSDEELYSIFLHEFSHVSDKNRINNIESRYNNWLYNQREIHPKQLHFVTYLFEYLDVRYSFEYSMYQYATSLLIESDADRAMVDFGHAETAASVLLKLHYDNMYDWERGVKNEDSIFKSETLSRDYLTCKISSFKKAISERSSEWNALVGTEILANNATHPTLKMRLENIGIKEPKSLYHSSSKAYTDEIIKALDYAENVIYEDRKPTYEKDREQYYLKMLGHIEDWKEQGMPITADSYADLISDMKSIGMNEEAEELCDRAIKELDENSSIHAYFIKGCALLCRYDERGMEYLYHAIENNSNYMEEGLQIIGTFCCYTGREKELYEYRNNATRLTQRYVDENSQISYLTKKDTLIKDTMPDEMLESVLSFIHSVSCNIIENIYLVRKVVSETFFSSVFIVQFFAGTNEQRGEIMHKIFRYLDSYPADWQFSLFDYNEYRGMKIENVEGSHVYNRSKGNMRQN
ncbi:MAG: M48 family metalloprotease [Clostridia bacterium]|nr:M48 family metalloprotease [Clostridia bacterium]